MALLVAACSGAPVTLDANAADAGSNGVADPLPPAPPALPIMTPCPAGWRVVSIEGGPDVCEPWAGDRAPACGDTELAIPGIGCQAIDTCPADGWPADLPATGVMYVRAGATGGNGSRAAPFATIPEGLGRGAESIVALAVGEYTIGGGFHDIDLRGACASGTLIRDPASDDQSAALFAQGHVHVEGVHAIGGFRGLWLYPDAVVTARNVILEGPNGGLRLDSRASFTGDRVRVVGSPTPSFVQGAAFAVWLRPHSSVTLRTSTVIGGARAGFGTWAGTGDPVPMLATVTLEDSSVSDSIEGITGPLGDITVRRSAFERLTYGVTNWETTTMTLSDVRFRDLTTPVGTTTFASGAIDGFGTVQAERVYVSRCDSLPIQGRGATSSTTLTDVVVTDTLPADLAPVAVEATPGSTFDLSRLYFGHIAGLGLRTNQGSTITARDVTVNGLTTIGGAGEVFSAYGGTLTVTRARVTSFSRALVTSFSSDASVTLLDVDASHGGAGLVVECVPGDFMACAAGMPARVSATRVRLTALQFIGIDVLEGVAMLSDVDIDGVTTANQGNDGIGIFSTGSIEAHRLRIHDTVLQAIFAYGSGSSFTGSDVQVDAIHAAACPDGSCTSGDGGDGVGCSSGASVTIDRLDASGAARAGIIDVDGCASMTFTNGRVHHNEIGVLTDETLPHPMLSSVVVLGNVTEFNVTDITLDVTAPVIP